MQPTFDKGAKAIQWKEDSFSMKGARTIGYAQAKILSSIHILSHIQKEPENR